VAKEISPLLLSVTEEGRLFSGGGATVEITLTVAPRPRRANRGTLAEVGSYEEAVSGERSKPTVSASIELPPEASGGAQEFPIPIYLAHPDSGRLLTLFATLVGQPDTVFFPLRVVGMGADCAEGPVYLIPRDQASPAALADDPTQLALAWSQAIIMKNLSYLKPDYRSPRRLLTSINRFTQKYAQLTPEQVHALIRETIALAPQHFDFADRARLQSLVDVESLRNPLAVSSRGAVGLAQLMRSVAGREDFGGLQTVDSRRALQDLYERRISVERFIDLLFHDERSDPRKNLFSALSYLGYLFRQFGGSQLKALAAYHCGDSAVRRALGKDGELNLRGIPLSTRHSFLPRVLNTRQER
jgi:hypothetical protein